MSLIVGGLYTHPSYRGSFTYRGIVIDPRMGECYSFGHAFDTQTGVEYGNALWDVANTVIDGFTLIGMDA
jgi:hypothetical protein